MTPLHAGDRLDNYDLDSLVADSGMASIFRATDVCDGSTAAIKVPHPEAEMDPILHERFRREIAIGERLQHPGIRKIIATPDASRLYIAMEWLDGRLLRQVLFEDSPMSIARAVSITLEILAALDYMHHKGVVHRDLKPENIMLQAPADANGEADIKIIDFGIAACAGARRITFGKLSQVMGSPDYIAPEQLKNKRGDARSDLYAVGVMLYEMLTGETPFQGANPFAVMNARLVAAPPPPSEINPEISPELDQIVLRALEPDPDERYASASEFARDLAHPEQIQTKHPAFVDLRQQPRNHRRTLLSRLMLTLLPAVVLCVLFYVARVG
jgi:serine/threonine-protein kinase